MAHVMAMVSPLVTVSLKELALANRGIQRDVASWRSERFYAVLASTEQQSDRQEEQMSPRAMPIVHACGAGRYRRILRCYLSTTAP